MLIDEKTRRQQQKQQETSEGVSEKEAGAKKEKRGKQVSWTEDKHFMKFYALLGPERSRATCICDYGLVRLAYSACALIYFFCYDYDCTSVDLMAAGGCASSYMGHRRLRLQPPEGP